MFLRLLKPFFSHNRSDQIRTKIPLLSYHIWLVTPVLNFTQNIIIYSLPSKDFKGFIRTGLGHQRELWPQDTV